MQVALCSIHWSTVVMPGQPFNWCKCTLWQLHNLQTKGFLSQDWDILLAIISHETVSCIQKLAMGHCIYGFLMLLYASANILADRTYEQLVFSPQKWTTSLARLRLLAVTGWIWYQSAWIIIHMHTYNCQPFFGWPSSAPNFLWLVLWTGAKQRVSLLFDWAALQLFIHAVATGLQSLCYLVNHETLLHPRISRPTVGRVFVLTPKIGTASLISVWILL